MEIRTRAYRLPRSAVEGVREVLHLLWAGAEVGKGVRAVTWKELDELINNINISKHR